MADSKKGLYYLKDKKLQIYKKYDVSQPGGMPTYRYIPRATSPLWGYATQLSQDLVFKAARDGNDEKRLFVINYHKGIDINQAVLYRGVWYITTRVDTADDYNGDIFIYVRDAKGMDIPNASQIDEYNPAAWDD